MKKSRIYFLLLLAILYSGCASRYADKRPMRRYKRTASTKSQDILFKIERENRNLYLNKLLRPVRAYLGTPFKFGGDTRRGMDCSGFVCRVFQDSYKMKLPHNASQQYERSAKIFKNDLRLGDLVFFDINRNGQIGHVGIYLGKNHFAHASITQGVVISNLAGKYYRTRYYGAGRILE